MSTQPKSRLTPEEYIAIERKAEFRSEYYDGEMFAMSGTSEPHNIIAGGLYISLRTQMRGKNCRVYMNEMRTRVGNGRLYTYPDIVGVCGERKFADNEFDVLLNPNFIAEVLSPSKEAYDRGRKFEHYRMIDTFSQYLLIAQDRVHLDLYTKGGDGWIMTSYGGPEDRVELQSIGCTIQVGDLYENVDSPGVGNG